MKCDLCGEEMNFVGWEGHGEQEERCWVCACGMTYGELRGWEFISGFKRIEEEQ